MLNQANKFDGSAREPDNGFPMECTLGLLADYASRDEGGKLNVMGIFDVVYSDTFPYAMPQFYVVVKLTAGPAEYGTSKNVELVLLNPDGKIIGKIPSKGKVPTPDRGGPAHLEIALRLVGVPFEKPGRYAVSVLVSGEEKTSIPIEAIQLRRPAKRKGRKTNGN